MMGSFSVQPSSAAQQTLAQFGHHLQMMGSSSTGRASSAQVLLALYGFWTLVHRSI